MTMLHATDTLIPTAYFERRVRVPGGWIYIKHTAGAFVFVPDPPRDINTMVQTVLETLAGEAAEFLMALVADAEREGSTRKMDVKKTKEVVDLLQFFIGSGAL